MTIEWFLNLKIRKYGMEVTSEKLEILRKRNCGKGKHRIRENKFGVCWCVLCGLLTSTVNAVPLEEDERITVKNQ